MEIKAKKIISDEVTLVVLQSKLICIDIQSTDV